MSTNKHQSLLSLIAPEDFSYDDSWGELCITEHEADVLERFTIDVFALAEYVGCIPESFVSDSEALWETYDKLSAFEKNNPNYTATEYLEFASSLKMFLPLSIMSCLVKNSNQLCNRPSLFLLLLKFARTRELMKKEALQKLPALSSSSAGIEVVRKSAKLIYAILIKDGVCRNVYDSSVVRSVTEFRLRWSMLVPSDSNLRDWGLDFALSEYCCVFSSNFDLGSLVETIWRLHLSLCSTEDYVLNSGGVKMVRRSDGEVLNLSEQAVPRKLIALSELTSSVFDLRISDVRSIASKGNLNRDDISEIFADVSEYENATKTVIYATELIPPVIPKEFFNHNVEGMYFYKKRPH